MAAGFPVHLKLVAYRNEGSSQNMYRNLLTANSTWLIDYEDGMKLVEELYKKIAEEVLEPHSQTRGHTFNLADEWEGIDYRDEVLLSNRG